MQVVDVFQPLSQHVAQWAKHLLVWDPKCKRIRRIPFVDTKPEDLTR